MSTRRALLLSGILTLGVLASGCDTDDTAGHTRALPGPFVASGPRAEIPPPFPVDQASNTPAAKEAPGVGDANDSGEDDTTVDRSTEDPSGDDTPVDSPDDSETDDPETDVPELDDPGTDDPNVDDPSPDVPLNDGLYLVPSFETSEVSPRHRYGLSSALDDFDGDGVLDIIAASWSGALALRGRGDGSFQDVTAEWGLDGVQRAWGSLAVDIEGDGDIDLILSSMADGNNSLFLNDGNAYFTRTDLPMTRPCAWDDEDDLPETHSIAAGDFDLDGDLDLAMSNGMGALPNGGCTEVLFNDGNNSFHYLQGSERRVHACGATASDIDNDGWIDLVIGDLGSESTVHWNIGPPNFYDFDDVNANTVFSAQRKSMIGETLDYDQDGDLDILVSAKEGTALYRNDGGRIFTDVTEEAGIAGIDPVMNVTSADVDSNGYPDILVSTYWILPRGLPSLNYLLLNTGEGTFVDRTEAAGLGPYNVPIHGFSFGDLNDDGMLDMVFNLGGMAPGTQGPVLVHLNQGPVKPNLAVDIGGFALNSQAVGTKVEVVTDVGSFFAWVRRGDTMGSSSGGDLLIGLGDATRIDDVIALYPDGEMQRTGPVQWAARMQVEIEHP
jgi:hypothetical protein